MVTLSLESMVVRRDELVDAEVNGEVVVLQTQTGVCYGLNLLGSEIWRAAKTQVRVADICAAIERDYEVDAADCERDVLALLEILRQEAMIDVAPAGEHSAGPPLVMSALAGLWRLDGRPDAARACVRMLAAQQVYGPHASDHWDDGSLALGRALFRLLPEDVHDRQPLVSAGGDLVLVADVRLDNREDLAAALGLSPSDMARLCDAAVLLAAFERWGEACLDRLAGDYAFAVWDARRRRLLLARDPLGQRPLHYHRAGDLVAFASMPKGLHALPEIPRAPDQDRVVEFVALLPEFGSRTCFKGVERVEAGHLVAIDSSGLTSRRHWSPERRPILLKTPGDYEAELRHLVDQAVMARLRGASGAVGTHLSAGLDSSVVTATAAQLMRQSGGRVIAFTSVPNAQYAPDVNEAGIPDEGPLAAATAAMHGAIDHVVVLETTRARCSITSTCISTCSSSRFAISPAANGGAPSTRRPRREGSTSCCPPMWAI